MGDEEIERVGHRGGVAEDERALSEVIEVERWGGDGEPGAADGKAAELTHIGVERLRSGDAEDYGSEGEVGEGGFALKEGNRVNWGDGFQDFGSFGEANGPENSNDDEPKEHDGAEDDADPTGAEFLDGEEGDENEERDGDDEFGEARRHQTEAFDRGEYGDRGGDHAIAVKEGGADHSEEHEERSGLEFF